MVDGVLPTESPHKRPPFVSNAHRKSSRRSSWFRTSRIARKSSGPSRTAGSVRGTRRQNSSPAQTSATPIAISEIPRGAMCVNAQKARVRSSQALVFHHRPSGGAAREVRRAAPPPGLTHRRGYGAAARACYNNMATGAMPAFSSIGPLRIPPAPLSSAADVT
jgi:hypothetical protein